MPHIIVKMYAGRSHDDKVRIADHLAQALMASAAYGEAAISVSIEDVDPKDWVDHVYKPDIIEKPATLIKKPGYDPLS